MQEQQLTLARVPAGQAALVVDVLFEAFYEYPVMRYVLGDTRDYEMRLQQLVGLFVAARALRDDVMLGVRSGAGLVAVATTSDPAAPAHPDFERMRTAVWDSLGADAEQRYKQCVSAWGSMASAVPQLHINMLGVRRTQRGAGLGRRLVEAVHALARTDSQATGVSLTTENAANVPFYRRLGYEVIGQARIAPELEAWSLFWQKADAPSRQPR
jgi:GNAT superfamily N-acetyltransferase